MELADYLDEWVADWRLSGKAMTPVNTHRRYLEQLEEETGGEITLAAVKSGW
jgi:hypothetical protein